jgi:hypothetical protein
MQLQKFRALVLAIPLGWLCLANLSYAQAIYGSIYGTVTDNTGAVVPNAAITVTDESKGTSVEAQSNGSGDYSVQHLIPDTYDVKVTISGFKSFEQKGIVVAADTSPKVDVQLVVGTAAETVTVSADTVPELKTDRADVSTVFSSQTITDLPIGDRNFTNLQLLLPGAQQLGWSHAADENPQASKQIQVDGQAFGGVAFMLDGTDNQDPILGIIVINPPLDAVSEAKITTQNFDAELGKAVSSVVTAQTKSGTNSFHGSAFDYRESNQNQARDPFTQNPAAGSTSTGGLIPGGLKNQFGGSVGGPVIKDRLFFFGDYQGVRQKVGTSASMTVPSQHLIATCLGTAPTVTGAAGCDFSEYATALGASGIIYQQTAGGPVAYTGNVIPAAQLSQPALNLFKLLQTYAPNKSGSFGGLENNYSGSGTGLFNNNQWDERVDYQLSQRIHTFERFSRFWDVLSGTTIFGPAGGAGFGINNYGGNSKGADDSLAAGADAALNASVLTDFRVGYYRYNVVDSKYDEGTEFATELGIPGVNLGDTYTSGAPGFNITDVGTQGTPNNAQSAGAQYGSGLNITRCNCPLTEKEDQFQVVNNWTKILGNHSIKFGADLRYARNLRVPSDSDRAGLFGFATGPTSDPAAASPGGLGFATFVLGKVNTFGRYVSTQNNAKEFQKRFFFYAQDSWRVNARLTVNYGVRYEWYTPESVNGVAHGALMNLNTGFLSVAGVGGIPSNMGWSAANNPWAPRLGVAYQVTPKTVVRSGYGRSFDLGVFGSIFGHTATQNLPVLAAQSITTTTGTTGYAFTLPQGPAAPSFPAVPSNGLLSSPGYLVTPKARPSPLRLPTIDAWNLSLQHSLTPTLSFTLAYVGNKATHTLSAGDGNSTNPNEAGIFLPSNYSIEARQLHYVPKTTNPDANGIDPDGGVSNNTLLQRYYGGAGLAACQTATYETQVLAYQTANPGAFPTTIQPGQCGWTDSIQYNGDNQNAEFNALQVTIAKTFSHNLTFTSNYAWQRGYDFNSAYSTWDQTAVKGRNNDIREQQEVIYGTYLLPFGKGQQFGGNVNGIVNQFIGGWLFSPVLDLASGEPFTLTYNECSTVIPGSAPCYPNGRAGSLPASLGSYNPTTHSRLFFTGASVPLTQAQFSNFTAPGLDQIGNSGRNNKYGPYFFNGDLSLQKNFPIHESLLAQFRVDGFNGFNHINPGLPSGVIDAGPQYISGQAPGAASRLLQFSLRVQF